MNVNGMEYFNTSKVSDRITREDMPLVIGEIENENKFEVGVARKWYKSHSEEVCAIVDIVKEKKLSLSNPDVTQFDLAVMDSVYTLAVSGITRFTPEDVARIMSGNLDQNLTSKKIQEVKESIEKLSFIRLTIDYTDEMIARGEVKPGKRTFELESYMVPVRKIEVKSRNNQTKLTGYQLLEMPILYQYAEKTHQIAGVPLEILNTPSISDTNDVIVIKRALIRRIEAIKNPRNNVVSESIVYERVDHTTGQITGFFAKLGFFESDSSNKKQWNKKRTALHKTVISILDDFKEKGYIAGYELVKEGEYATAKINGVKIIIN